LQRRLIILVAVIAAANLPDWPIPGWGHDHLFVSHSIFVNGAAFMCLAAGFHLQRTWVRLAYRRLGIGLAAAWLSHFILDSLYVDSRLAMFWPLSEKAVSLPVPWLKTLPHVPPPFDQQVIRILLFETLTFLPLLVLAVFICRWPSTARVPDNQLR
jgi:membrane-bound metal-dependent hydrolase YbcI (DUF457 family)